MKKIIKSVKKNWKIHLSWCVAVAMIASTFTMIWSLKEIKAFRMALKDAEQTLQECRYSFEVWESQIESGSVKVLKRDGDNEIIERWEMTKEPATEDWMLK